MEIFDVIPKELQPKIEMAVKDQRQHEFKLVGRQRKVPGHTLFSLNLKTGEIKPAPIEHSTVVDFRSKLPMHRDRIVVEPHCVYRQALNRKNFIKKMKREGIIITRVPLENDIIVPD